MPRTMRPVRSIDYRREGAFVKLDCGHEKWIAGLFRNDTRPTVSECMQGPCLKLVQSCGAGW